MNSILNMMHCGVCACVVLCSICLADDQPESSEAIQYKDIGRRFHIEGEYGKVYTDFKIRGVILSPTGKDPSGTVRIEITHIGEKELEEHKVKDVVTKSQFEGGSKVELLVREQARLWYPEGIDDIGSNPYTSHFHKLQCVVSLHQREMLSCVPPGEKATLKENKNSEQVAPSTGDKPSN